MNAVLATLGAFLAALVRPRTPLVRAIRMVLFIKLIAIAGIGVFMFAGRGQVPVGADLTTRLLGPVISQQEAGR